MRSLYLAAIIAIAVSSTVTAENRIDEIALAEQLKCLALNVYYEARSESEDGKLAVGHVVLNRMADNRFPNTICDVVKHGGDQVLYRCQFSWWCDGKSDTPTELTAWNKSVELARLIVNGQSEDPTSGAKWYHADYVQPGWAGRLEKTTQLGRHIFYTDPPQLASTSE